MTDAPVAPASPAQLAERPPPQPATDGGEAGPDPAVAPPPGNPRFPQVDSVRAIAALTVLLTHTSFVTGAIISTAWGPYAARLDVGVAIFFVISGFLLYRPFVGARLEGRPPPRILAYARRRVLRIVPAYWLALTVLWLTIGLPGLFDQDPWVYYLFLQTYSIDHILGGIGPAWTLCIEVTFYLLLPFWALAMAALLGRRPRRTQVRAELAVLLAVFVADLALRYYLREEQPLAWVQNTLATHMDWFALGMAVAVWSAGLQARPGEARAFGWVAARPLVAWLLAGAAFYVTGRWVTGPNLVILPDGHPTLLYAGDQDVYRHVLYGVVGVGILLPAVAFARAPGLIGWILTNRVLMWLGLVSYGIYLWHHPLVLWLHDHHAEGWVPAIPFIVVTTLTAAAAISLAALSYYLVEKPILRFKDGRPRRARPATAATVPERPAATERPAG
jgi:peptidoglycan/LPS O-acetylase OafA/YrhL